MGVSVTANAESSYRGAALAIVRQHFLCSGAPKPFLLIPTRNAESPLGLPCWETLPGMQGSPGIPQGVNAGALCSVPSQRLLQTRGQGPSAGTQLLQENPEENLLPF